MAWDHLSVDKPHLVYIILGGFTTLFMLCSSIIKERLYIGEATVATLCGVIFGPHAANLINPASWGNVDKITLEFSRIVLVVQCFAVGVELPKNYMERHWRSVVFLLVPVMTFGWLITSLFIWAFFHQNANWLDCLCIAACVTATDPVLASSVVGKGKFAKRVPKHLRDILSAESGCNDGMAFPFIYLALYIIRYKQNPDEVALEWFCITILYECVFGAFYGFTVGYIARRLIRLSHEKDWIDRESFLVFYFVLALFCAGSGSLLGMDDLLIGFACGVGFSNDGWFTEKTEETHVSNVIDLLLNLSFFVYFGTIIPWAQYDNGLLGLKAWKLVVIAILVIFFRRIPIMMALKPLIPDIKTWREALFAGHFGPIGVGAIFVSILARAELETGNTEPTTNIPNPSFPHYNVIVLIWPITTFLILTSILIHGSSVAVFTLGKHINTLTLTLSYTQANEQGPTWMDRLPRIQSRSKSSMSMGRYDSELDEKPLPEGMLPPIGKPGTFLRRQREEDSPSRVQSRSSSRHRPHSRQRDAVRGPGGPISQSAIAPQPRLQSPSPDQPTSRSDSDTLAVKPESSGSDDARGEGQASPEREARSPGEIYEEGNQTVFEDREGNVLAVERESGKGQKREDEEVQEGERLMHKEHADENHGVAPTKDDPNHDTGEEMLTKIKSAEEDVEHKLGHDAETGSQKGAANSKRWRPGLLRQGTKNFMQKREEKPKPKAADPQKKPGPARAYQYGNTIVIEDEDGEVIKKYDIPAPDRKQSSAKEQHVARHRIGRMGKMLGIPGAERNEVNEAGASGPSTAAGPSSKPEASARPAQQEKPLETDDDDDRVRFTLGSGGRRMSKAAFIDTIQQMDPKRRVMAVENSNMPEPVKQEARKEAREQAALRHRPGDQAAESSTQVPNAEEEQEPTRTASRMPDIRSDSSSSNELKLVASDDQEVPFHNVSADLRSYHLRSATGETAAERRRRQALQTAAAADEDSDDDGTERIPPGASSSSSNKQQASQGEAGETAAERRRREGALGLRKGEDSESDEDGERLPSRRPQRQNIRFADQAPPSSPAATGSSSRQSTLRWGSNVK